VYCNECVSSIRHLLHSHLSLSLFRLPLSLQIVVSFLRKVFLQSIHWVQSLPQLVFHFSPRFPPSRAPLYTRRARVSIYVSFLTSFSFPSFLKCSQLFFFLPLVAFLSSFSPLSIPVFFFSLFPSFRAHNCIIERLFSQLTLFLLSPFCYIPDLSRLDT